MDIKQFPLAWRWTQASHALFSPDVLASLTPLHPEQADELYQRGEKLFGPNAAAVISHHVHGDPTPTLSWLRGLPIPPDALVLLAWDRETAISLPWQTFIAYWDDFCYPSSDDAFIFFDRDAVALAWNHHEVFQFIRNAA